MCDYSDAYITLKGKINVKCTDNVNTVNKELTLKNNAPFRSCMFKINNTFLDNVYDFDIDMLIYNLLEYSDNYFITLGVL